LLVLGPRKHSSIEWLVSGVLARARTEYDEGVAVEVENSNRFILKVGHVPSRF
jgi:hypothetical protein